MADAFGSLAPLMNQGLVTQENDAHFRVERNFFISLLAQRIAKIKFAEAWFLSKYPDAREAIDPGVVQSARTHYVQSGY
jgi:hypothetical protein